MVLLNVLINLIKSVPLIRSLRSLLKDLTKSLTKVISGDLSIIKENNVMPRRKPSFDWLKTHVTKSLCSECLSGSKI